MDKLIGEITKNKTGGCIKVRTYDYKGETYLDVRNFFKNNGADTPTKKGISISKTHISEIINLMSRGEAELNGAVKA